MAMDAGSLEVYRATRRRRQAAEAAALADLRERAWAVARRAGDLLRERYGARKLVLFGSLVESGAYFDRRSDIDLAAWGICDEDYFVAVAQLQDVSPEFSIDLVAMERCPEHLHAVIESTGVPV